MNVSTENKCCCKYDNQRIAKELRLVSDALYTGLFLGAYYFLGVGGVLWAIGLGIFLHCLSTISVTLNHKMELMKR